MPDEKPHPDATPPGEQPPASQIAIPDTLPILPVRDSVAFPGTIMPLGIRREKSKRLIESVIGGTKLVGIVTQRDAEVEEPGPDDLFQVGTVCVLLKMITVPDGGLNVIVHGLMRLGIERFESTDPVLIAKIKTHPDSTDSDQEIEALVLGVRQSAHRIFDLTPNIPEEAKAVLDSIDTPGGVADFLGANLSMETPDRQRLLEALDVRDRLRRLNALMAEQVEILELSSKIQDQVKRRITRSQREYFLQEQLKAIREELGESDDRSEEIERIEKRIAESGMPEAARAEADRELERLKRIPQASPEYSVALDYVEWLCDLPWTQRTDDNLDLDRAERILDEDHYDLEKVKKRILEFLAVRKLNPKGRGPILCFLGPPGVGKTSLGQSIARALGRKFIRISLGGIHDEAQLRGHRRTYIGAMPGRILQEIRKAESNNPVFMLDEVDKIGQDFRGDPASALLEVLDPQQNNSFSDNYIDVPFDLSNVMFIGTANAIDPIPSPLRDRMEIIPLAGYITQEKLHIAKRYLVPRQLEENGLTPKKLAFTDDAIRTIISGYTREAGVRNLEREIGAIARAVAAKVARGNGRSVKITPQNVKDYLGPERFGEEAAQATSVPGVATGLAWTPVGGQILFIESTRMRGKGQLTLTGQMGDVMRESAQAAYSILRSRAQGFKIDEAELARTDVHVHVPAGAIPKDGPSAGVAMLASIVSLFTDRPCRHDLAMTGEITLAGRVLPVGGIKEKVLAAHRAGIHHDILPEDNRKDLEDIPEEVRRKMTFTFAARIDRVLAAALEPAESAARKSPRKRSKAKPGAAPRGRGLERRSASAYTARTGAARRAE